MTAIRSDRPLVQAVHSAAEALCEIRSHSTAMRLLDAYPRLDQDALFEAYPEPGGSSQVSVQRAVEALREVVGIIQRSARHVSFREGPAPGGSSPVGGQPAVGALRTAAGVIQLLEERASEERLSFCSVRAWLLCRYLCSLIQQIPVALDTERKWQGLVSPDPVPPKALFACMKTFYDKAVRRSLSQGHPLPIEEARQLHARITRSSEVLAKLHNEGAERYSDLSPLIRASTALAVKIECSAVRNESKDLLFQKVADLVAPQESLDTPEALDRWSWSLHCFAEQQPGMGAQLCQDLDSFRMERGLHRKRHWELAVHEVVDLSRQGQLAPQHGMSAAPLLDLSNRSHLRALQFLIGPLEGLPRDTRIPPEIKSIVVQLSHTSVDGNALDKRCVVWNGESVCWKTFFQEMRRVLNSPQMNSVGSLLESFQVCWQNMLDSARSRVIKCMVQEYEQQLLSGQASPLDSCEHLPRLLEHLFQSSDREEQGRLLKRWRESCREVGIDHNLRGSDPPTSVLDQLPRARAGSSVEMLNLYGMAQQRLQKQLHQYHLKLFQELVVYSAKFFPEHALMPVIGRFIGALSSANEDSSADPFRWLDRVSLHRHEVSKAILLQSIAAVIEHFLITPPDGKKGRPKAPGEGGEFAEHPECNQRDFVLERLKTDPEYLWNASPELLQDMSFLLKALPLCQGKIQLADAPAKAFVHLEWLGLWVSGESRSFLSVPPEHQTLRLLVTAMTRARKECSGAQLGALWAELIQYVDTSRAMLQQNATQVTRVLRAEIPELWACLQVTEEASWEHSVGAEYGTWQSLRDRADLFRPIQQVSCSPDEALAALETLQRDCPERSPLQDSLCQVYLRHADLQDAHTARQLICLHRDYWQIVSERGGLEGAALLRALAWGHEVWNAVSEELWLDRTFISAAVILASRMGISLPEKARLTHPMLWGEDTDILEFFEKSPEGARGWPTKLYVYALQADVYMTQHLPPEVWQDEAVQADLLLEILQQKRAVVAYGRNPSGSDALPLRFSSQPQDVLLTQSSLCLLTPDQWNAIPDTSIKTALQRLRFADLTIFNSPRLCRLYCSVLIETLTEQELQLIGKTDIGAPYAPEVGLGGSATPPVGWQQVPPERRPLLERLHTLLESIPIEVWNSEEWRRWVEEHLPDALLTEVPRSLKDWNTMHEVRLELWNSKTFVRRAVRQQGTLLERAFPRFKRDPDICTLAVTQDWQALPFCSVKQNEHPQIPQIAMSRDCRAIQWVHSEFPDYPRWAYEALETCPPLLAAMRSAYRSNVFYLRVVREHGPKHLVHMSKKAWASICKAHQDCKAHQGSKDPHPQDIEWLNLAHALLRSCPSWFEHFPEALREDPAWQKEHLQALQKNATETPHQLTWMSSYEWSKVIAAWNAHRSGECTSEEWEWITLADQLVQAAPQHFGQVPLLLRNDLDWMERYLLLRQAARQGPSSDVACQPPSSASQVHQPHPGEQGVLERIPDPTPAGSSSIQHEEV